MWEVRRMAKIYARWIAEGKMRITDVPARWRDAVAALLGGDGA